ncbi:hypothetical protein [Xanthocytophaga agilis]|uniref:Uncharacterized protein n=1 Tax=Xanthocytophaga agilis TaxID=3048010 RepID=A0AAE3R4L4_9BACT|nr:hypothetical protein [Xanthocytophaga agilis]MDJ1503816.1 hypothetical protein [Xanthocytophaga agilis]
MESDKYGNYVFDEQRYSFSSNGNISLLTDSYVWSMKAQKPAVVLAL